MKSRDLMLGFLRMICQLRYPTLRLSGYLTHLRYDRLTTLVNPNRERWRFEYDAASCLTEYRHDAAGQVTKAVELQKEERFFWDAAGNRTGEHRYLPPS
ncbi:RHS repeat domain-containing protein [Cronobacter malonaticus]|uniref:RHS repeat domain-containing protein n=1 Tax=Cronobacter malonaticus TaxID=413503 RepID=UPI00131A4076|nr:RHS repeat domain-containing protein [Cronobacter malonaticus]ELY5853567.1 hypothetical protein [Cronobacter malonaticus]WRU14534.1 RHS repeat domain-containing protein [Cronobacter malonaticus]